MSRLLWIPLVVAIPIGLTACPDSLVQARCAEDQARQVALEQRQRAEQVAAEALVEQEKAQRRHLDQEKQGDDSLEVARTALQKAEKALRQAEKEAVEARDQWQAELKKVRADAQAREQVLLHQIEDLKAKLTEAQKNPQKAVDDKKVEIKVVDRGGQFVKINLGSDAGLDRGQTLEVFRLSK